MWFPSAIMNMQQWHDTSRREMKKLTGSPGFSPAIVSAITNVSAMSSGITMSYSSWGRTSAASAAPDLHRQREARARTCRGHPSSSRPPTPAGPRRAAQMPAPQHISPSVQPDMSKGKNNSSKKIFFTIATSCFARSRVPSFSSTYAVGMLYASTRVVCSS